MRIISIVGAILVVGCFGEAPSVDEGPSACAPIEEPDPVSDCPALCNGGCAEDECQILCTVDAPCHGALQCPESMKCDFDCSGDGVCTGAQLACPNDYECSLTCEGANACADAELTCGFSECAIECGTPQTSCMGTVVHCSSGACLAECIPGAFPTLDRCDDACTCERC